MFKKLYVVLLMAGMLLAACAPVATIQPTSAPVITAATLPDASSIKVGLVTDIGGVNDRAFNQLAWEGVQKASMDMGLQAKLLESREPTDYGINIDILAAEGYHVIITVGALMGDATALKAEQYPHIKFAMVDHADINLPNVTSLMFAEEQVGFLAGVLAGGMSRSGFVCSVSSLRTPASGRYMMSFFQGATWQAGPEIKFMNNYINIQTTEENVPSFNDSTQGRETALGLIGEGCDLVFAIGGEDVRGALIASRENNLPGVGADVDQYEVDPEVQSALITSAMKNVDVAVYNYLKAVADGSVTDGISMGTLQNGGVGMAPFHDWEGRVPADLQAQIQKAIDGIKDGSIMIALP